MSWQIENTNKETEIMKRNQREILELKSTTEIENSLEEYQKEIWAGRKKNKQT